MLTKLLNPRTTDGTRHYFNSTNRLARIWYLRRVYAQLILHGLHRIGVVELVRTQFPYIFRDPLQPPSLNVEFTNHCQLVCTYCTSPLKLRPVGIMSAQTFTELIERLDKHPVRRIRVVGNGEPTLHPRFVSMIYELRRRTRYLELKTNWQLVKDDVLDSVLSCVDVLRISVDSDSEAEYERVRQRASFRVLLQNLRRTTNRKCELKSKTLVLVTVMLRPSDAPREAEILTFWQGYCDLVSKQYVLDMGTGEDDSYVPKASGEYPLCSFPFKELKIFWSGEVPLCKYSHIQTRDRVGLILGTIASDSLRTLWSHPVMRQYRMGHRSRNGDLMPICKGCIGT